MSSNAKFYYRMMDLKLSNNGESTRWAACGQINYFWAACQNE